ncbi:MAG: ABC transporter ATP-binding protein [Treponema sp.]|nr:ABC transporter ATP-binding protein [Treponema sp.]
MPRMNMRGMAKPKNVANTIKRIFRYLGIYKLQLFFVMLAVIVSSGATVACDSMLKPAINNYIVPLYQRAAAGEQIVFADFYPFLRLILLMAVIFVCGALATWVNSRLMLHVSTQTLYRIRRDLFDELERLPMRYYDAHTHGELMSLFTNDTDTLRDMMSQSLPQLFSSIISVTAVFVMMLITSPILTLLVIVTISLMLFIVACVGKRSAAAFRDQQAAIGKVNGYIEELIEGQRVVKVFNHEEAVIKEFCRKNDELCEAGTRANTYANILGPFTNNVGHIQYALVSIAGAAMIIRGMLDLGSIAAFLQYTRAFTRPISMMSQQFNGILNALAGAERIFACIDEENELDEGTVTLVNASETLPSASGDGKVHLVQSYAQTGEWAWRIHKEMAADTDMDVTHADREEFVLRRLQGDVDFKDVSFSYVPEKEVLHHIDLHARPGEKIALVGSTGSGKTTITNLLTRFYDIEDGKGLITYDGIPLKDIKKDDLRHSLGMVLQDTHLFTGSIRDNIRYGNLEASESQIVAAAKLANADYFIRHLEKGYDTVISGDGGNLSQGQRQLLAIARAAVADPPVLILDEATSSIDTRTEALIEKGMDSLMEGRTVFVIAHRLSTVRNANEIIVLEKGTIIERGNHDSLMAKKGRYYDLYTGAFELS